MMKRSLKPITAAALCVALYACGQDTEYLHRWDTVTHRDPLRVDMLQLRRPLVEDKFLAPDTGVISVSQDTGFTFDKVDILMVVDNSPSMDVVQRKLAQNLPSLLQYIGTKDWQIAVVTGDPTDSNRPGAPHNCPRALVKKSDMNAEAVFAAAVNVGIGQEVVQRGIRMAARAVSATECNTWMRTDSFLGVIIVSSEDNCKFGPAHTECPGEPGQTADYLVNAMAATGRRMDRGARVYAIISPPGTLGSPQAECASGEGGYPGNEYASAVTLTRGIWGSICDSDYAPTLRKISKDIGDLVGSVKFDQTPILDTVKVTINGRPWAGRVEIVGGQLVFVDRLPQDSNLEVSYRPFKPRSFNLTRAPVQDSIQVRQDNLSLTGPSFNFAPETKTISIAGALKGGELIRVSYIEDIPLLNQFKVGKVLEPELMRCFVNGKEVAKGEFTYKNESGDVEFSQQPPEGAVIRCDI